MVVPNATMAQIADLACSTVSGGACRTAPLDRTRCIGAKEYSHSRPHSKQTW